jgi:hypothetical protein
MNTTEEARNIFLEKKVGLGIEGYVGIGDLLQYTHLPENIFKNFGVKLYDPHKYWVFNKNPYVIRNESPSLIILLDKTFDIPEKDALSEKNYGLQFFSRADRHCKILGIKTFLRHNCLYDQETQVLNYNQIVIHVGPGKSTAGEIPDNIIEFIKNKYKNFKLIQVGSNTDKNIGVIDKRGCELNEMIEIIKNSFMFIGVNSGPMNIANCYPNIFKKIIITDSNNDYPKYKMDYETFLSTEFVPQRHYNTKTYSGHQNWLDFFCLYFNISDHDMGVTCSYKKI